MLHFEDNISWGCVSLTVNIFDNKLLLVKKTC